MKLLFLMCVLACASLAAARPLLMEQGEQMPFYAGSVALAVEP